MMETIPEAIPNVYNLGYTWEEDCFIVGDSFV